MPTADPLSEAANAVRELNESLAACGITLPSLRIDLPSCGFSATPRPLVELGRCNLETARRLTLVLREAAR
ncbi:hypothetical protein [Streptomyces himalayensis]|uniref:Uncharacterized protein n=1 Tax=Streptomyces himalayensis subsp. himalayensis TaxID=2756131 RepID=A0A7W0DMC0_9ACTN|nr:hypothetical protein [Streptomyces himalayensis]MBA2947650.1 hypothetical protein [Streptomyces himalayensis subsp. himalayensis]